MAKGEAHIEVDYFLAAIQDGGTFSKDYRWVHDQPDTVFPAINDERLIARLISASPDLATTGAELVSFVLRFYTDEWLATGVESDGKESPFSRKLTATKYALGAVGKHEYSWFPAKVDWDNGLAPLPISLNQKLNVITDKNVPARPVAPLLSLPSFDDRPPRTKRGEDNWLIVNMREHRRTKLSAKPSVEKHRNMPKDVFTAALLRADTLFHALMKAPWRFRLGKCKRCNIYFPLKVNPSRIPYVRGMHCFNCKNTASAEASAKSNRQAREEKLVELAARAWKSWRPVPGRERNKWVAEEVSNALGKKRAIQRNWVTRHEKDILYELEKRARGQTA